MKKLFSFVAIIATLCIFAACSGGNTPSGVVQEVQKAAEKQDYKAIAEYIYVGDGTAEEQAETRQQLADMMEQKASQSDKFKASPMKIISEEIAEDGQTAKVVVEETEEDGTTKQTTQKLRKDAEGNWKLDIGK